jgi:DHA1 family multidrug resistance protein-like MFS transporter
MNWRKNLYALVFGSALSSSSYTMVVPFLPLYLLHIGANQQNVKMWSGVVFSATFLVAALLAPYWGRRADRKGKRKMVIRAGFSLAVVYFLGAFVQNPVELLIVRILQGVANGFLPASLAIVAMSAPKEKLGPSLGLMQTSVLVGGILGPLAGGILSHLWGMRASFIIAAGAIGVGTMAVRFLVTEPENREMPQESSILEDLKTAFGNRRLLEMLALLFVVQIGAMTIEPLITLYIAQLRGTMAGAALIAGIVYSLAGIAGAVAAPLWGRLGQEKGFYRILIVGFLCAGIFSFSQYFVSGIYRFAMLQLLYGVFLVGVYPAVNTIAVTSSEPGFQGRIFGLTTTANQLGSMVGPLLGGIISSEVGIKPVFLFTGSLLFMVGLVVLINCVQHRQAVSDAS